jgi:hypothetical protein
MEGEPEGKGQTNDILHFWLTDIKKASSLLGQLIQENNELVVEHLKDENV